MKEQLKNVLSLTNEDALFWVYFFTEKGTHSMKRKDKSFVADLLNQPNETSLHPTYEQVLIVEGTNIGISLRDFAQNIRYDTPDVDGFEEHVSKFNKYHNIFIKLDKVSNTITFKLGTKCKTLELVEHTDYVSRPYKRKYMQCVTVEALEKHIHDDSWNPRMIEIGRHVLGVQDKIVA